MRCRCYAKSTGKQCKKTAINNTFYCSIHQKCTQPIDSPEEKKILIVNFIKGKLAESQNAIGKENKKKVSIDIYKMLSTNDGKKFVNDHPQFKVNAVKNKLIEFIEIDKLPEFIPYYETILDEKYIPPAPRIRPQIVMSRIKSPEFSMKEIKEALEHIKV